MKPASAHPFRCPDCGDGAELELRAGEDAAAYVCSGCDAWFPVQDGIADFSSAEIRDNARWHGFREAHGRTLGLPEDRADAATTPNFQRDFYDSTAGDYDEVVVDSSFWRAHDRLVVDPWMEHISPTADVLDLGAGTGRVTIPLAQRLAPEATLLAVDISFETLRIAAAKLRELGLADRVLLAVGDCTDLGFLQPRSFDVAVAYGFLHHLPEPEQAFGAIDRPMRESASLLIHDNNRSVFRRIFDFLMRLRPLWEGGHDTDPFVSLADLERWAAARGFQLKASTSVFVPPHLCERLTPARALRVLQTTNRIARRVPFLRWQGGLILAEAHRGRPPVVYGRASERLEAAPTY